MAESIRKHWRLVALALGIIIVLGILYALRTVILPFALGLVLAYLLMPFVSWLERKLPPRNKWPNFKRVFSVLVAFILLLAIIGGFAYFIVTAVIDASVDLLQSAPTLFGLSLYEIQLWFDNVMEQLPLEIRQEVKTAVIEGGISLGNQIRDALFGIIATLPSTVSTLLGFAALPFFLFYIMKDSDRLQKGMTSALTHEMARHARNVLTIVERVLGRYIRAQIMLGIIVAYFSFIGLLLLGLPIKYIPVLALLAGATELIPILGPWIGGAIAVIVTLAVMPDMAIWVAVLFIGIQMLENYFLVPRIQGGYLKIHPAVMILLLIVGAYVAGFWGLLLAGPLVATLVQIFKYIHAQYQAQEAEQPAE